MKNVIRNILAIALLASCHSTDLSESEELKLRISKACEDTTWLDEKIEELKTLDITARLTQYTYEDSHVFMIETCIDCTDSQINVYTCEGTPVCTSGGIGGPHTCGDFFENATHKKVIWHN